MEIILLQFQIKDSIFRKTKLKSSKIESEENNYLRKVLLVGTYSLGKMFYSIAVSKNIFFCNDRKSPQSSGLLEFLYLILFCWILFIVSLICSC